MKKIVIIFLLMFCLVGCSLDTKIYDKQKDEMNGYSVYVVTYRKNIHCDSILYYATLFKDENIVYITKELNNGNGCIGTVQLKIEGEYVELSTAFKDGLISSNDILFYDFDFDIEETYMFDKTDDIVLITYYNNKEDMQMILEYNDPVNIIHILRSLEDYSFLEYNNIENTSVYVAYVVFIDSNDVAYEFEIYEAGLLDLNTGGVLTYNSGYNSVYKKYDIETPSP